MDDLPEILDRKVGAFPVWQWLAIGAAGVALALVVKRYTDRDTAAFPSDLAGMRATGVVGGVAYGPNGAAPGSVGGDPEPQAGKGLTSNREWLRAASKMLAGSGFSSVTIDSALRRYLRGDVLEQQQISVIEAALRMIGPPPEGAPPVKRAAVPSADLPGPDVESPDTSTVAPIFQRIGIGLAGDQGAAADGLDAVRARIRAIYRNAYDRQGVPVSYPNNLDRLAARLQKDPRYGDTIRKHAARDAAKAAA